MNNSGLNVIDNKVLEYEGGRLPQERPITFAMELENKVPNSIYLEFNKKV